MGLSSAATLVVRQRAAPHPPTSLPMKMLLSAWPALALLLPVLWLVSVIVFLAKGNRRAMA